MAHPALAQVDLFRTMDREELEILEQLARKREYFPKEVIFRQGDPGVAFFVVSGGKVRVTLQAEGHDERELVVLGPGQGFGEMALFNDRPRSATVTAIDQTQCLAIHRSDFLEVIRTHPVIAVHLLDTLSQRLTESQQRG